MVNWMIDCCFDVPQIRPNNNEKGDGKNTHVIFVKISQFAHVADLLYYYVGPGIYAPCYLHDF